MGLKVNSYCIFGESYCGVLPLLLRANFAVFPRNNWQLRIYHDHVLDKSPYKDVLLALDRIGLIKTIYVPEPVLKCKAMLWRMMPIWDDNVDFVFCKDADAIPTIRERKIMQDFMASPACAMGINDNPGHSLPMMGGMIGFNCEAFRKKSGLHSFKQFMEIEHKSADDWNKHGADQWYLHANVFPKIQDKLKLYRVFAGAINIYGLNCCFHVPENDTSDITPMIRDYGDKFINYIGAAGTVGPLNANYALLHRNECNTVFDFYDKFGDQESNEIIRKEERRLIEIYGRMFT